MNPVHIDPQITSDIRRMVMRREEQVERELTPEELVLILAADTYAHRDWHKLSTTESLLVDKLVAAGYLDACNQGFTGPPVLPV